MRSLIAAAVSILLLVGCGSNNDYNNQPRQHQQDYRPQVVERIYVEDDDDYDDYIEKKKMEAMKSQLSAQQYEIERMKAQQANAQKLSAPKPVQPKVKTIPIKTSKPYVDSSKLSSQKINLSKSAPEYKPKPLFKPNVVSQKHSAPKSSSYSSGSSSKSYSSSSSSRR